MRARERHIVDLLDLEIGGLDVELAARELKQQLESIRVRVARIRARAHLDGEPLPQVRRDVRGDRSHSGPLSTVVWHASEMLLISSGVASKYQKVPLMLACPRYVDRARIQRPAESRSGARRSRVRTAADVPSEPGS
jgi:hypothetical protein